jgi:hypothetical protein
LGDGVEMRTGPESLKLVMSVLISGRELEGEVLGALELEIGNLDLVSQRLAFEHTDYYSAEMGPGLLRRMVSFRELVHPGRLVELKLRARAMEDLFRGQEGNRRVNLDPGLLGHAQLVLATHKPHAHRIYLDRGVYAELTLIFRQGSFRPLLWTYPDYASEPLLGWLHRVRELYLWQRRQLRGKGEGEPCGA